jgi:hypothetical protein
MKSQHERSVVMLLCALAASCGTAAAQQAPPAAPAGRPPYRILAVNAPNGGSAVAGTLTVPEGAGPFPTVVILPGPTAPKDDTIADQLTRHGIAVHRHNQPVAADIVTEALAVVTHLRTMPVIDARRIGLWGRSWDPATAARTAPRGRVAFVLLVGDNDPAPELNNLTMPKLERRASTPMEELAAWILKTPPR